MQDNSNDKLDEWMRYRMRKDRHLGQMKETLDRKQRLIERLEDKKEQRIAEAMDRKAQLLREFIDKRNQYEDHYENSKQAVEVMHKKFDGHKFSEAINKIGSAFHNITDPVGYVSRKVDQENQTTVAREQNKWDNYFVNFDKMKVSEEVFEGLKNIAKKYNVRWQPSEDGKLIIATLGDYLPQDHEIFAFVYNGNILEEVELPVSRWDLISSHYRNIMYYDKNLDNLDFAEKILYKILPKKNHIKKFCTSEEHFLKVYNKMTSK